MKKLLLVLSLLFIAKINFGQTTYTFSGNGLWSDATNWNSNLIPPVILPNGSTININPTVGGNCILDRVQTISQGGRMNVIAGAKLIISGAGLVLNTNRINSFGYQFPNIPRCRIRTMYQTSEDTSTNFIYNNIGLLIHVIDSTGNFVKRDIRFYYDTLNRLTKINDEQKQYELEYGNSTLSIVQQILITDISSGDDYIIHCIYPSSNKITGLINYPGGEIRDSLELSADFNLPKRTVKDTAYGFPAVLLSRQASDFSSINSFLFSNALADYYLILNLDNNKPNGFWPVGLNTVSQTDDYFDLQTIPASYNRQTLIESIVNVRNFPTYLKYSYTNSIGEVSDFFINLIYDCF